MYKPLYPPEGAPCLGFVCTLRVEHNGTLEDCGRVTRTERGMKAHAWKRHGVKRQMDLFGNDKPKKKAEVPF